MYLSDTVISPSPAFWLAEKSTGNAFKCHTWTFPLNLTSEDKNESQAQHSGCFSIGVRTLTSFSVLSFKEGTDCSLYFIFQDFSFFNVFSECVWVTVVVRSQVVVLVLRGSVVEETRCPYQEAGWTGNPAEATNVIVETYLTRVWTLQCKYKMYQCNKSVKNKKGKQQQTNIDKWRRLENQMDVWSEQNKR